MKSRALNVSRRRLLLATFSLPMVACGGGETPAASADVVSLRAERARLWVGERASLLPQFSAGVGRIEPGIGAVVSGVSVMTPPLARDTRYRLVVETPNRPNVERSIDLQVGYRNQYSVVSTEFGGSLHAAVSTADGAVLLIGGSRGLNVISDEVTRYDPVTRSFKHFANLLVGRSQHRATLMADGRVLVTGGATSIGDTRQIEAIDALTGQVKVVGQMSVRRVDHAALLLRDGRLLVTGGATIGEKPPTLISSSAEIWDPASQTARRLPQRMAHGRCCHSMTELSDGNVLIVGGYVTTSSPYFAELFDPKSETFTPLSVSQPVRANHVAFPHGENSVLVLGGETFLGEASVAQPTDSVLRFNLKRAQFEVLSPLRQPRTLASAVQLPGGDVLLFGGQTQATRYCASVERYDPPVWWARNCQS